MRSPALEENRFRRRGLSRQPRSEKRVKFRLDRGCQFGYTFPHKVATPAPDDGTTAGLVPPGA